MPFLSIQQLLYDRLRTSLMVLAISAVIAAVLVLSGFELGLYKQSERIIADRGADIFVVQEGVNNFIAVRSSLRQSSREEIESIPGVVEAHPITSLPIIYEKKQLMMPINMLVYDVVGGPANIVEGTHIQSPNEVVIDQAIATAYGAKVGDEFILFDFSFRIAGITSHASAFMMPFVFVSYDGLLNFIFASNIAPDISVFPLVSFLLVDIDEAENQQQIINRINQQIDGLSAFTPEDLINSDIDMIKSMLGVVINFLLYIAYIIGSLVVGLIIYADVRARLNSYAVLKALGFRLQHFIGAIFVQTLTLFSLALPIGVVLALIIATAIEASAPLYRVPVLDPGVLIQTCLAGVVFSIIGGLLPLRLIANTDPATALHG